MAPDQEWVMMAWARYLRLNSLSLITFLTEYPKSTADKQTVILTNVTALKIPCSRHEISC